MTDGNEDRFDVGTRPDGGPDHFARMSDLGRLSPIMASRGMLATQQGLGATDGRDVNEESQVRGQTEAARMGYPLSVDKYHVGLSLKQRQALEYQGRLTEGEKAGHIGPRQQSFDSSNFCQFK